MTDDRGGLRPEERTDKNGNTQRRWVRDRQHRAAPLALVTSEPSALPSRNREGSPFFWGSMRPDRVAEKVGEIIDRTQPGSGSDLWEDFGALTAALESPNREVAYRATDGRRRELLQQLDWSWQEMNDVHIFGDAEDERARVVGENGYERFKESRDALIAVFDELHREFPAEERVVPPGGLPDGPVWDNLSEDEATERSRQLEWGADEPTRVWEGYRTAAGALESVHRHLAAEHILRYGVQERLEAAWESAREHGGLGDPAWAAEHEAFTERIRHGIQAAQAVPDWDQRDALMDAMMANANRSRTRAERLPSVRGLDIP